MIPPRNKETKEYHMLRLAVLSIALVVGVMAQTPPVPVAGSGRGGFGGSGRGRGGAPTRDPHTPGYVTATELPDGQNPSPKTDGNFIIGPTHPAAPEMSGQDGVPQGEIFNFTMESTDSKIYPGIAKGPAPDPTAPPSDICRGRGAGSHPAPYTRKVAVYVPKQYVPGTVAPFIVGADGIDNGLFAALNNLISQH